MNTVFAHHDKISAVRPGIVLIVSEPVRGQFIYSRSEQIRTLPAGTWLRVKHMTGGLWCDVEWDGKVQTVVINSEDFGSIDVKP